MGEFFFKITGGIPGGQTPAASSSVQTQGNVRPKGLKKISGMSRRNRYHEGVKVGMSRYRTDMHSRTPVTRVRRKQQV